MSSVLLAPAWSLLTGAAVAAWSKAAAPPPSKQGAAPPEPATVAPADIADPVRGALEAAAAGGAGGAGYHGLFHELLLAVVAGGVQPTKLAALLSALRVGEGAAGIDAQTALVDSLWLVHAEVEQAAAAGGPAAAEAPAAAAPADGSSAATAPAGAAPAVKKEDAHAALGDVVRLCVERGVIPARMAVERLEVDLLGRARLVAAADYNQRLNRAATRMMFTQAKFNLLAEESEGYAKLVAEVMAPLPGVAYGGTTATATSNNATHGSGGAGSQAPPSPLAATAAATAAASGSGVGGAAASSALAAHMATLAKRVQSLIGGSR